MLQADFLSSRVEVFVCGRTVPWETQWRQLDGPRGEPAAHAPGLLRAGGVSIAPRLEAYPAFLLEGSPGEFCLAWLPRAG